MWRRWGRKFRQSGICDDCCQYCWWPSKQEEKIIPNDVPKGHLVVYVGEYCTRYVVEIKILRHPLFKALLDQAQEVYDFTNDSKLHLPCNENIFLSVVQCAKSPANRRIPLCLWLFDYIRKMIHIAISSWELHIMFNCNIIHYSAVKQLKPLCNSLKWSTRY